MRAGQQPGLGEHLEPVADSQHGNAAVRGGDDLGHDGRVARDGARAEVVAVAESAGEDDRVDVLQVVVAVPERNRGGAGDANGALRIPIVERAGKGDDADPHRDARDLTAALRVR